MRIVRNGEIVELRYSTWKVPLLFAVAGVICIARLGYLLSGAAPAESGQGGNQLVGMVISSIMFPAAVVMFYEINCFRFDVAERLLVWSKRRAFRRKRGMVPFADIESVVVEGCPSGFTSSSYRVVLVTKQEKIPVSESYSGTREMNERFANQLRACLGKSGDVPEESLREMVRLGRKIDAIRYARERYGLSLADARKLVDSIPSG